MIEGSLAPISSNNEILVVLQDYRFEIPIKNSKFKVTAPKKFTEIFLWDSKGNCRSLNVRPNGITDLENGSFLHVFDPKVHIVSSNIDDRKYIVEFLNPGISQDMYRLDKEKFNAIKVPFLTELENNPQI